MAKPVTFDYIEGLAKQRRVVSPQERGSTVAFLSTFDVERMNTAIFRSLVEVKEGKVPCFNYAHGKYEKFLASTSGHPVYQANPWLAAYVMFAREPAASKVARNSGHRYSLYFETRSGQKLSWGEGKSVKVPFFFQPFTRSVGKPKKVINKNMMIQITEKDALSRLSKGAVHELSHNSFMQKMIEGNYSPKRYVSNHKQAQDAYKGVSKKADSVATGTKQGTAKQVRDAYNKAPQRKVGVSAGTSKGTAQQAKDAYNEVQKGPQQLSLFTIG